MRSHELYQIRIVELGILSGGELNKILTRSSGVQKRTMHSEDSTK
jgi:hypothetical protein